MAFTYTPIKIELTNGSQIELPRMTLGKILAVTNAIAALVKAAKKEFPELFEETSATAEPTQFGLKLLRSLPEIFPILSEQIVKVVAVYINQDEAWVRENLDMEDIANIAPPFLASIMKQGNHLYGVINQALGTKKVETDTQSIKPVETPSEVLPN